MKSDEFLNTVIQETGVSFFGRVIGTGFKYITQLILANILGAGLFGIYGLGIVIYQLGELLSMMGLQNASVRYVSIHHGKKDIPRIKGVLWEATSFSFFSGLFFCLVLLLLSRFIAYNLFVKPDLLPIIRIFAFALPFGASMNVLALATTGFKKTKFMVYVIEILQPLINLLLIIVLFLFGFRLSGAAGAWFLSLVLGLAIIILLTVKYFPQIIDLKIKSIFIGSELYKFSIPLAFGSLLIYILLWTDSLLLGYFRSSFEVGIYRAASQTVLVLTLILVSFNTIFGPIIADFFDKKDKKPLAEIFKTVTRWTFMLTLPIFLVMAICSREILSLFGADFAIGWVCLAILSISQLVNVGTGAVGLILIMSGHQYQKLAGDFLMAMINVLLNLILIPRWGIVGAAIATSFSIVVINLMRVIQVFFALKVHPYNRSYWKTITAGTLAGLSGFALKSLFFYRLPFFISLAITSLIIFLIYIVILWCLKLEESDRIILGVIQNKLAQKNWIADA